MRVRNEQGKVIRQRLEAVDENPGMNPFINFLPSYIK